MESQGLLLKFDGSIDVLKELSAALTHEVHQDNRLISMNTESRPITEDRNSLTES